MDDSQKVDANRNSTQDFVYTVLPAMDKFKIELEKLINCHSLENGSDTPDFILAEFLVDCMKALDRMVKRRDEWYGDKHWGKITGIIGQPKEGKVGNAPE